MQVQIAIQEDESKPNQPSAFYHPHRKIYDAFPPSQDHLRELRVHSLRAACQYKVCPRCRPVVKERAFLNLGAVANGEVPPIAAAGYGFHVRKERPIANADVVRSLGYRAIPCRESSGVNLRNREYEVLQSEGASGDDSSESSDFSDPEALQSHIRDMVVDGTEDWC